MSSDMEPDVAKRVAMGDADPVTLLPMEDINPTYIPRAPLVSKVLNSGLDKGKGKAKTPGKSASEGILHFFGMFRSLWCAFLISC